MTVVPCEACGGTGEQPVPEPQLPGASRVVYSGGGPRSCTECEGDGRVMTQLPLADLAVLIKPYL